MTSAVQELKAFLAGATPAALVEVASAKGSTPREEGASMLVSRTAILGTIGGGQLEFMAIDKARQMLGTLSSPLREESPQGARDERATLDIPLGPEIGQCCGGRVEVLIRFINDTLAAELIAAAEIEEAHLPQVFIFGGGHVGQALAASIALLPVHAVVVETRTEALEGMSEAVETRLTPVPEEMVRQARPGAAFVVLTHDHALDFLIVAEALKRGDAAYVGMIGSKTKKATFKSWFLKTADGSEAAFSRLVSPIGGDAVKDKRPTVIAALAAAEIMTALAQKTAAAAPPKWQRVAG
jgi:xanthine dehydrogenase accessory factor